MPTRRRLATAACAAATCAVVLWSDRQPSAQARTHLQAIAAGSAQAVRQWDSLTAAMLRGGELRVRDTRDDTLVAGRVVERADQYYRGVRVFGADVARQIDGSGVVRSIFGNLYSDIAIDTTPDLDEEAVRVRVAALAWLPQPDRAHPELVVLPSDDGSRFSLAWRMRAVTASLDIIQYFLDARSGEVLLEYSDRQSQAAVGRAVGVLGDSKKISVSGTPGRYLARDLLRPPLIQTDDMKGDPSRTAQVLSGALSLDAGDIATRSDLNWTDGAVDDAQVYAGYTYDYYYKRFGRKGLDDENIQIVGLVNPVRRTRDDLLAYFTVYPDFFVNAFYAGGGMIVYGVGLPPGSVLRGQSWTFTSGALDLVGHELTHGVTEFTSNLIYR